MKKLKKLFGSTANLASGQDDPAVPGTSFRSSRPSVSGSAHSSSPNRGSYISYETRSLDSYNSNASAGATEVDPNSKLDKNFTKLHKWAYLGDVAKLKKFIKKVPVDAQDSDGKTALHHAAAQGRGDALLFLLGSKGNVELPDNAGMTPFLRATEKSQLPIVQMLIQRRVDMRVSDYQGNNCCHHTAKTGATELLTLLLDCGIDCDISNNLGRTPLHLACTENQHEAVEALLRHGASVNVSDKEGVTPLMAAAKIGSAPLVESLVDHDADVNPIDASKWSAADYARFTNHNQLHNRLKSLMEKVKGVSLFPNDLLNVSDEGSSPEEGTVGIPKGGTEGKDDETDSWNDNSDVDSVKEKPKINLTKFLPSSDESADNLLTETPEPSSGGMGPPKPPRAYASSSSLASGIDRKMDEIVEDDAEVDKDGEREERQSMQDDDSWKSSSEDDVGPKFKPLKLFNTEQETQRRDLKLSPDGMQGIGQQRVSRVDLMAELGLDKVEYQSSDEDVSFEEDDAVLPLEGTPRKVTISRRNSQAFDLEKGIGVMKSATPRKSPDQMISPKSTSPESSQQMPLENREPLSIAKQLSTESEGEKTKKSSPTSCRSSARSTPKKASIIRSSPLRKTPKKVRPQQRRASVFDSDSDSEWPSSPQRPPRRKSVTPTKRKSHTTENENLASNLNKKDTKEAEKDETKDLISSGSNTEHTDRNINSEFDTPTKIRIEENENLKAPVGVRASKEGKNGGSSSDQGKSSDGTNTGGSQGSLLVGSNGRSRTSTLSTVIGTLGREGTMQEVEEVWEANASLRLKKSSNSSSNQTSEDSPEHDLTFPDMTRKESRRKSDVAKSDSADSDIARNVSTSKDNVCSRNDTKRNEQIHVQHDGLSILSPRISSQPSANSIPLSSEVSVGEDTGGTQAGGKRKSKESLTSPRSQKMSASPRGNLKESISVATKTEGRNRGGKRSSVSSPTTSPGGHPITSTPHSRVGSANSKHRSGGLGNIVFSDEDSISQDFLAGTPRGVDEIDGVSAASTETEESAHINSGIKDSLLTPLSSLPDASDVGQLQDLVRELRLKLEKEFGRRVALETRVSHLQQQEKQTKLHADEQEQELQRRQQEISSLAARIKQMEYHGRCEQDSSRLKDQTLEDVQLRCTQLEEQCCSLRKHDQQQGQLVESLMVQLQTKERITNTLQGKLEELVSQTKYVSMKSCQTEDVYISTSPVSPQQKPEASEVSTQTSDSTSNGRETVLTNDAVDSTGSLHGQQASQLQAQDPLSVTTASTQTENKVTLSNDGSSFSDKGTQSERPQLVSAGIQNIPETLMRSCQTQPYVQNHHVQTDLTLDMCVIQEKKSLCESSCQVSSQGKQVSVQTDSSFVVADEARPEQKTEKNVIDVQEVTSALEPLLHNYSQEVSSLITDVTESNQTALLRKINQLIVEEIGNLRNSVVSSVNDSSTLQNEEMQQKLNDEVQRLEDLLRGQADTVAQLINNTSGTRSAELKDAIAQVNSGMQGKCEELQRKLTGIEQTRVTLNQNLISNLESRFKEVRDDNERILRSLNESLSENKEYNAQTLITLKQDLVPEFSEVKRHFQSSSPSEDSGISANQTRGILDKLDTLEKSLVSSFEKSIPTQDFSSMENDLHKMSEELQKKIVLLQQDMQTVGSDAKLDQAALEAHMNTIKENNKQFLTLLKSRSSEANTDISEALEEHFHILQDHLRKLQHTLVQRMNEISQQSSITEDQKVGWLSKQMTEMVSQVSGMQTSLTRLQASIEASQNLPNVSGMIDETLISALRSSNEQAVMTLKFQNQSVIQLLEALQKEVQGAIQARPLPSPDSKVEVEVLKETLRRKENELQKIAAAQETLQEKLQRQNSNLEHWQRKENEQRLKTESLLDRVHDLECHLKEKEQKINLEAVRVASQKDDASKIRQENFRLTSENGKLSTLLQAEQQQRQWYEGELHSLRDAREAAETKAQEMMQHLQVAREQAQLQRTPPTGRDHDDDDSLNQKKQEIKKLEGEKEDAENRYNEQHNRANRLEVQLRETEADLGLERGNRDDLEKHLKKAKDTVAKMQKNLAEANQRSDLTQDMEDTKKEMELEIQSQASAMALLRKRLDEVNKERMELKQDIMNLKGEKLSYELMQQEKELAEQMQKKTEQQLLELQRKIPHEYVPKSNFGKMQTEVEAKYQLELNAKISELNHLLEKQNQENESRTKAKESREQEMKFELNRMSEEIIRLRAKLSVIDEQEDTWKLRHDRLMNLYEQQAQTSHDHIRQNTPTSKPKEDSLAYNLREISAHLQTPYATSTLLGQLTPPTSLQLPKPAGNIDSYHYTHSDTLDRTIHKYLSAEKTRYLASDDKPQARIPPMQPSGNPLRDRLPNFDESCDDYISLLKKKYGL